MERIERISEIFAYLKKDINPISGTYLQMYTDANNNRLATVHANTIFLNLSYLGDEDSDSFDNKVLVALTNSLFNVKISSFDPRMGAKPASLVGKEAEKLTGEYLFRNSKRIYSRLGIHVNKHELAKIVAFYKTKRLHPVTDPEMLFIECMSYSLASDYIGLDVNKNIKDYSKIIYNPNIKIIIDDVEYVLKHSVNDEEFYHHKAFTLPSDLMYSLLNKDKKYILDYIEEYDEGVILHTKTIRYNSKLNIDENKMFLHQVKIDMLANGKLK